MKKRKTITITIDCIKYKFSEIHDNHIWIETNKDFNMFLYHGFIENNCDYFNGNFESKVNQYADLIVHGEI